MLRHGHYIFIECGRLWKWAIDQWNIPCGQSEVWGSNVWLQFYCKKYQRSVDSCLLPAYVYDERLSKKEHSLFTFDMCARAVKTAK